MEIPASHLRHSRAPRARIARSGAPWVRQFGNLQICHSRNFDNHVTVRPTDCPSAPQAYQCKITQPTDMATHVQFEVILEGNRIAARVL